MAEGKHRRVAGTRVSSGLASLLRFPVHSGCHAAMEPSIRLQYAACAWACSSAGRAPRSQRGGQRFDPAQVHQIYPAVETLAAELSQVMVNVQPSPSHPLPLGHAAKDWVISPMHGCCCKLRHRRDDSGLIFLEDLRRRAPDQLVHSRCRRDTLWPRQRHVKRKRPQQVTPCPGHGRRGRCRTCGARCKQTCISIIQMTQHAADGHLSPLPLGVGLQPIEAVQRVTQNTWVCKDLHSLG